MAFNPQAVGARPTASNNSTRSKTSPANQGKKPTLDKVFADQILSAPNKHFPTPWAMKAESSADEGCVYLWGEHCWEYVAPTKGRAVVTQWLDTHHPDKATSNTASALWNYTADRLRLTRPIPECSNLSVIPTLDGYLYIQPDGSIRVVEPDPKYGVDYVIKANLSHQPEAGKYVPSAVPPEKLFGQFLDASLPDMAIRAVVQELCGQTLLGTNYGVAGWFVGKGANGKGVLMEVIEAIHRQACRLKLDKLSANFALEKLLGASLVLVDEVANEKFDEEIFKTLITGNGVDIDRKYDKPVRSYHSRAKWLISSNNVPHIADRSDGVWRRIIFVPWKVQISEENRIADLDKRIIAEELDIVLDWMLAGAVRIVRRGRMLTEKELPETIRSQKQMMRLESDSVLAWADEEGIHSAPNVWTANDDIYQAYSDWCANAQRKPLGVEMFWKGLRNRFEFETEQRRTKINGKPSRKRYSTISLKPPQANRSIVSPPTARHTPLIECEFLDDLPF